MKKIVKEISQLISGIIILFAGLALTLRFLDGRLLLGVILIGIGIALLVRMAVVSK